MPAKTIRQAFIDFHTANPEIYDLFARFTEEALRSGMKKVGAKFVFERIRWELYVATTGAGWCVATKRDLKLNNNFTAWYARLYMAKNRHRIGVFELRTAKSK